MVKLYTYTAWFCFLFVLEHSAVPEIEKQGLEKIDHIAGILSIFLEPGIRTSL